MGGSLALACVLAASCLAVAHAADAVPFGDRAVVVRVEDQVLEVAAAGLADGQGRLAGQVLRARTVARGRALRSLHAHADRVLSRRGASAAVAERVHAAVTAAAEVAGTRQLSDASVVVLMQLSITALDGVWPDGRGHWGI